MTYATYLKSLIFYFKVNAYEKQIPGYPQGISRDRINITLPALFQQYAICKIFSRIFMYKSNVRMLKSQIVPYNNEHFH